MLGFFFDLAGGFGIHVADADAGDVEGELFEEVEAVELGFDLFGEGVFVHFLGFGGIFLFLLDLGGELAAFFGEVGGDVGFAEGRLFEHVSEHQADAVLAGELVTRAGAAMRRLIGTGEVGGAFIGVFAGALALAENNRLIRIEVKGLELPLHDECPAVFRGVGIRGGGFHITFINGDHETPGTMARSSARHDG